MTVEHRIIVEAHPEVIFGIYEDVGRWHTWDANTQQASLTGPFETGTRGRLVPTSCSPVPIRLADVVPNRRVTVECRIPFFRVRFEHELRCTTWGTEVLHRVVLAGLYSRLLGPMLYQRLDKKLPITLARLKALAESNAAA